MLSALNAEKHNTEVTKHHRGPQRNRPYSFRHQLFSVSSKPSVRSVAFLRVLCVKFRKAQLKMRTPCKQFDAHARRSGREIPRA